MSEKNPRSKKRSGRNSEQSHSEFVLYLDRNLGKYTVADRLRETGQVVEIHDDHLPIDAPDEDWISLVVEKGWVAVTKDKNIRYRIGEIDAIRRHGARVFVVRAKNATGSDIADVLVSYLDRIRKFANRTPAPFVVGIDRSGKITEY